MGPPPPYQPMPPPQQAPIGFVSATSGTSTTIITTQQPTYGSIPVVVQPVRGTDVIVVGGCPACRVSRRFYCVIGYYFVILLVVLFYYVIGYYFIMMLLELFYWLHSNDDQSKNTFFLGLIWVMKVC